MIVFLPWEVILMVVVILAICPKYLYKLFKPYITEELPACTKIMTINNDCDNLHQSQLSQNIDN